MWNYIVEHKRNNPKVDMSKKAKIYEFQILCLLLFVIMSISVPDVTVVHDWFWKEWRFLISISSLYWELGRFKKDIQI